MTETPTADAGLQCQTLTFKIGDKDVQLETGRMARSASGAVVVRCEDTVILVTATGSEEPRSGIDFFPLLCDFEEKMYAVGRIPGGFIKREGRPSEKAVLTCRLMDRPIRPLWPDNYYKDVQVVASPLSADSVNQLDTLAMFGAAAALELSGLPFEGPIGAIRVGRIDGRMIPNPTYQETEQSDLDLIVAGTEDSIMMVEAGAKFVSEADMLDALAFAHEEIKKQVAVIRRFREQCGIAPRAQYVCPYDVSPLKAFVESQVGDDIRAAYRNFNRDERKALLKTAKDKLKAAIAALADDHDIRKFIAEQPLDHVSACFKGLEKRVMRAMVLDEGVRADGRKTTEIRPITCEVGVLPRVHGSALFTRGNTQVLSICTLGAPGDKQDLDGVDPATEKRWIHHYSFPAYSVGEVRPTRGPGRREIGHGALAARAIEAALPEKEAFPYTIRVNSEVLESNGSTSMASTCGSSMALMHAGVPLCSPISGIAMGLIKEGDRYVVLSDIQGVEDFLGDMDFKVTGNDTGITALQMDIKIRGISLEIMREALEQARQGRLHILGKMNAAIAQPNAELSPYAPRILTWRIDKEQIGSVIGPGGKTIRGIIEQTGATIDIEDDGLVTITSVGEGGERALAIVQQMTMKIEAGMLFKGKVVRIIPIGAFVELTPGKDGMVHISQVSNERIQAVEEYLAVDDEVLVKVKEIDEMGRVNLTIKGIAPEEWEQFDMSPPQARPDREERAAAAAAAAANNERGGFRGGRGGGGDRGGRGGGRPYR
ncbi:MAG: polyribonucleotide nucleotidyltransferase [Vampirovibrionales bacterium]|nr:polyribonucleotide nucleotidyltransferase [Vampirovibrionales bacterium]